jgi:hypothetical protein
MKNARCNNGSKKGRLAPLGQQKIGSFFNEIKLLRNMKMLFIFFAMLTQTTFLTTDADHAFHLSKTDIVFQPKEKTLQITMHLFIDDLEIALEKQGHRALSIGTEKEKTTANSLIINYLQQGFSLTINDKKADFSFVGKEATTDRQALWIYLEVKNLKNIKTLTVENKLLTEVHPDQKNMVQIMLPTKKANAFVLEKNKPMATAKF